MNEVIKWTVAIVMVTLIWASVMWGLWALWGWVLPQVYPSGPPNLIAPGFWLFAACWMLVAFIGRALFGRK